VPPPGPPLPQTAEALTFLPGSQLEAVLFQSECRPPGVPSFPSRVPFAGFFLINGRNELPALLVNVHIVPVSLSEEAFPLVDLTGQPRGSWEHRCFGFS